MTVYKWKKWCNCYGQRLMYTIGKEGIHILDWKLIVLILVKKYKGYHQHSAPQTVGNEVRVIPIDRIQSNYQYSSLSKLFV